jgi:hypothetical protein
MTSSSKQKTTNVACFASELLGKIKKYKVRDKFVSVRTMKVYAKGAEL